MPTDRNALGDETSPYLLQHKDNPVHWQPWGEAALAAAQAADKPILLSIGYAACHWCHVMAQESFEEPGIAALMNERFVNIKVDREERPDLDTIYMQALHLMGEQGGWPLTMFLTPEGDPFWGGTYFPPASRYGRPGFPDVLRAISEAYVTQRAKVATNVTAIRQALARAAETGTGAPVSIALIDRIADRLVQEVDGADGGLGGAPKFPQVPNFELFWRAWRRRGEGAMKDAVLVTLDHIAQGGIYDHLGGGFARYATDAHWLVPHFEKMLYDNALLIELMTLVWQETRNPLYAERVAETIEWLRREMRGAEGGFASSLDADSEHEEGKFYVWSAAEIDALLGPASARFKEFYDVSAGGNWEGSNILNRRHHPDRAAPEIEAELRRARAVLLAARGSRVRPGLDDKKLADWNGLMIAALAQAAQAFARPDWLDLARDAFAFIAASLADGEGRLLHSWRAGKARNRAVIDDYANMSRAALALYEATGEAAYLARARLWVDIALSHYWDEAAGGFFFTAADTEHLIARTKTAQDQPNPSGNGTMVGVLARLYYLTGEAGYRSRAEAVLAAFAGAVAKSVFGHATLLNGAELLERGLQIVIIGQRGAGDTDALLRAVNGASLPDRILSIVAPQDRLPDAHPAAGKSQLAGRATAYICEGNMCGLPLTDPAELAADLAGRH
jgi:uncharacterized protein YyaL (SSP411 family)